MQVAQQLASSQSVACPRLKITNQNGRASYFNLDQEQSAFVGSGSNCRIQLKDESIRPMHCILQFSGNQLVVQDWNTDGNSFLNGTPILTAVNMMPDDELQVGQHTITLEIQTGQKIAGLAVDELPEVSASPPPSLEPLTERDPFEHEQPGRLDSREDDPDDLPPGIADSESVQESEFLLGQLPSTDDLQLMQEEIQFLQSELAQKDEQILILTSGQPAESVKDDCGTNDETERLVMRLEELIGELDIADQRLLCLDEQLRMSDEANRAEREERKQLESWVEQIENMVSNSFEETTAEMTHLKQQVKDLRTQRDLAVDQLKRQHGAGGSPAPIAVVPEIAQLQTQLSELQECLQRKEKQIEALTEKPGQVDKEAYEKQILEMDQKIRQLQVDMSREQALIARQRAEFAQVRSELEQKISSQKTLGDDDCRFKAMRQHLRELHAQEQQSRQERREQSLAGRISRLWKRLDQR